MATGLIGTLGLSSTLTYTATADSKLLIVTGNVNGGNLYINGANFYILANSTMSIPMYLGAGQTAIFATGSNASAAITVLEGN